jgi:hypothetical protein
MGAERLRQFSEKRGPRLFQRGKNTILGEIRVYKSVARPLLVILDDVFYCTPHLTALCSCYRDRGDRGCGRMPSPTPHFVITRARAYPKIG